MEPTPKSPEIEELLSSLLGVNRADTIRANRCVTCGGEITSFRDALSEKEYSISGMCQKCQDEVFNALE